jgi:hypothetical protein
MPFPHGRIRCFRRNLMEQRRAGLNGAERWPHLVAVLIHNTGWVSPRLIPGSPQSLSELLSYVRATPARHERAA